MNQYNDQIATQQPINTFTLQDLIDMVLKKWYWFVISVVLFLGLGVLYILSTPPVYHREATIMVKDSRKGSGASEMAIFGELAGLSTRRNVDNELFVLQARRLMTQVVKELGLTTSYSTRVNLRKVDLYRCSPVSATFINDTDELTCAFKLELGEESFTLYDFTMPSANDEEIDYDDLTFTAPYGSTIATPAGEIGRAHV